MMAGEEGVKNDGFEAPVTPSVPQLPPGLQRVLPRTIPGPVSPQNKGALDWGWQGLVAYGAQTTVVVVDPVTLQCTQTLSRHRSHVVKVRWRKTRHYHQLSAPYTLTLASADLAGTILVWDVTRAEVTATLSDGNKPVLELEWLGGSDGSEHLLAALHPPYALVVWDTRHNTRLWRKSYTETLTAFHFDPFHANKMAFLCAGGCILFVEDFALNRCPSSNGRKFYVSAPRASPGKGGSGGSSQPIDERTSTRIRRKMRELVVGEAKPKGEESGGVSDCLQLSYHRTVRDQLLLVYAREVLILDLAINQTVGILALDRSSSPFTQVWSCWQRDVVYSLHESGSVAAHFRRRLLPPPPPTNTTGPSHHHLSHSDSVSEQYCEVAYDRKCHSEALRLNRQTRPIGLTLDPVSEKQMAIVLGDGRVVFKEVTPSPSPQIITNIQVANTPLFTPGVPTANIPSNPTAPLPSSSASTIPPSSAAPSAPIGADLNIADNHFGPSSPSQQPAQSSVASNPKSSLADLVKPAWALPENVKDQGHRISLRILMTGLMPAVAPPPLVIRSCPPLTTRNMSEYVPRLAGGTHSGLVQIFNLATGMLEREFALHTYPVRGVEWTSLTSILSFGHQPLTNSAGLVRNELVYTDILTGRSITLRPNKTDETSIDMLRVSYLKQYFIVVFRDDPFELWDARKLVPLRTMPRRFPRVTALEWSPTSHVKARRDSESPPQDTPGPKNEPDSALTSPQMETSMTDSLLSLADVGGDRGGSIAKETFVFTDTEGQLYHFSVEGNVIKDGTKVPPDSQLSAITSVAWKSHEIVLGDSEGNLTVWDLKTRVSRHIATHRGWIKRIRFAPGRDNMKLLVLFADGVDIWDVREVVLVSQLRCPGDCVKVIDGDWGASDRPVLATADGCIRVLDLALTTSASNLTAYCNHEPIVSPYLLPAEASLNLRTILTQQPWRSQYSLTFTGEDGFTPDQLNMVKIWLQRTGSDVREFLMTCGSTAHRALATARLFGDQAELDFWTVACHYLSNPSLTNAKDESDGSSSSSSVGSAELINLTDAVSEKSGCSNEDTQQHTPHTYPPSHPLETTYHNLCDAATYKHHELERLAIQESKNLEGAQRAALGRSLAMAGERDRAVRLLLDADATNTHFYTDCLRACLLAATHHSPQAQSTIKLVATNLIAAGNVWEGVELLCMIGKASDACRYLQSYGQWQQSVWLAKCALNSNEASDILKRWAHHLINTGNKDQGVCVLLSIGSFGAAVEQLVQQHYHQRAALLLTAAQETGALPTMHTQRSQTQNTETTDSSTQDNQKTPQSDSQKGDAEQNVTTTPTPASSFPASSSQGVSPLLSSTPTLSSLVENIHRKYVLHLFSLGNRPAVSYYCTLLGDKGRTLVHELDALQ